MLLLSVKQVAQFINDLVLLQKRIEQRSIDIVAIRFNFYITQTHNCEIVGLYPDWHTGAMALWFKRPLRSQ